MCGSARAPFTPEGLPEARRVHSGPGVDALASSQSFWLVWLPSHEELHRLGRRAVALHRPAASGVSIHKPAERRSDPVAGRTGGLLSVLIAAQTGGSRPSEHSAATGITDVAAAVRAAGQNRFTVPPVNSRSAFEAALTAGEPGDRRVVISDLTSHGPQVCHRRCALPSSRLRIGPA